MVVSRDHNNQGIEVKTKQALVSIGKNQIVINDLVINQPGEYDASGVACEVSEIGTKIKALAETENILIGVLNAQTDLEILSEDYTKVSLLFLFIEKSEDLKTAEIVVAKIEPQIVFYSGNTEVDLSQLENLEKSQSYKVSKNDLFFEGTKSIYLE